MKRPEFTRSYDAWRVSSFMEPATHGKAELYNFHISADDASLGRLKAHLGDSLGAQRHAPEGDYIGLRVNDELWMSDTPNEYEDHDEVICWASGRVLVHGLGLGCVVSALLSQDVVDHIDVVEIDPDVIALVGPYYEGNDRVTIHQGDCATYKWPVGTFWNYVWHDIWSSISPNNLDDVTAEHGISYGKMHRKFAGRCDNQGSWAWRLALKVRERERQTEGRAERWLNDYNAASHDRRVVMLLQATTPKLTSTAEWTKAAKVLPAPKGEGTTLDHFKRIAENGSLTAEDVYWLIH